MCTHFWALLGTVYVAIGRLVYMLRIVLLSWGYILYSACCRRWRLPPDRWWPLAVTGGNHGVGCWFLKR